MGRGEIEELAASVRYLLDDPDSGLTEPLRRRWEGALVALEVALGTRSSLATDLEAEIYYKRRTERL
jgi:hypothetical protein